MQYSSLDDTIAAIASAPGGAARGIVRISGPQAIDCLEKFFEPPGETLAMSPSSPRVVAGRLRLPDLHSSLPCDVYVWGESVSVPCTRNTAGKPARYTIAPDAVREHVRSYTGQPVVEIHTLGSPPLLQIVLRALCAAGARLAGPGEYTLRAFLAGRIDLTQAEAVLGVIDAGDPHELHVALEQLAGGLARPMHRLRDALLELLAHLEAGFDFADEDLSFITRGELDRQLAGAENSVAAILRQMASRSEPIDTVRAVLVGRPNTGKSSLFNALAGDQAALVSEHPGTTRDYLVAELNLNGVRCRLIDTAGTSVEDRGARNEQREAGKESAAVHGAVNCPIDQATESATAEQRRAADVQMLCLDSTRLLDDWERNELANTSEGRRFVVLTKCDAPRRTEFALSGSPIETSSVTGNGMATLREELRRQTLAVSGNAGDVVAGTAARCAESLRLAGESLKRARLVAVAGQEELAAAEIRTALEELGKVVGAVYTEDVLDRIFSRFCVGK
jgi:tRNA modification GTPase